MKKESKLKSTLQRVFGKPEVGIAARGADNGRIEDLPGSITGCVAKSEFGSRRDLTLTHQELLIAFRKTGDKSLAEKIYRAHLHKVVANALHILGNRDDAQDAAAEIFAKVLLRLRIETPDNFPAWLHIVTRHHCFEVLRKIKQAPILEPLDGTRQIPDLAVDGNLLEEERVLVETQVRKALLQLPENQRICIQLFFFADRSYKEIAESHGYNLGEVKSFIQNGKRRLAALLAPLKNQHVSDLSY